MNEALTETVAVFVTYGEKESLIVLVIVTERIELIDKILLKESERVKNDV